MKLQTSLSQFKSECSCTLLTALFSLLLSNAITSRRDKSILYSRVAILVLLYSSLLVTTLLFVGSPAQGITLFGGLFLATPLTNIFHIFIFFISVAFIQLTAFQFKRRWAADYTSPGRALIYEL
jgi:NADH-ubiquinone oxidoreductase chain 2